MTRHKHVHIHHSRQTPTDMRYHNCNSLAMLFTNHPFDEHAQKLVFLTFDIRLRLVDASLPARDKAVTTLDSSDHRAGQT